jgi:hypothetical protein
MAQAIKGIRIDIGRNSYLDRLLRDYRKGKNLYLRHLQQSKKTSLSAVRSIHSSIREETGLSGANASMCGKDALAIYNRYRKKKKGSFPVVRNKSMSIQLGYNGKLKGKQIRITYARNKYIYLDLKLGKYHEKVFSLYEQGLLDFGEIIVKQDYCVFTIKKEYTPYKPEGVLSLDINERQIVGLAMKGEEIIICA